MPAQVDLVLLHGILSSGSKWDTLVELLRQDDDLAGRVRFVAIDYPTKAVEPALKRQLPDLDSVAGHLGTVLAELTPPRPIVLAAHSQGGLVVQRYLVQQLQQGLGLDLRRMRSILMFATPNSGSEYLLPLRKWFSRNPQENELRPLNDKIVATQRVIMDKVVNATEFTATTAPIRIEAYAGMSDRVVLPQSAKSVFPHTGDLVGDHSSIIEPRSTDDLVYRIIKSRLLRVIRESESDLSAVPTPGWMAQLDKAIDEDLRSERVPSLTGYQLREDAVRQIASALAKVPDLGNAITREQFASSMPDYIRQRLKPGGRNLMVELADLVRVCADYEETGRDALVVCLEWALPAEDPAVRRALGVIEAQWPPGGDASHTG